LDIVDTRDTLLLWLQSCRTDEQIILFGEVVEDYIVNRFREIEPPLVIDSAKQFLLEQMDIHLTILNQKTPSL
jgi:hypothetical protein